MHCICALSFGTRTSEYRTINVDGRHSCRRDSASNPRETRFHYTKLSRNQLSSSDACRLPYMKISHITPVGYSDILPHTYIAYSGSRTRLFLVLGILSKI